MFDPLALALVLAFNHTLIHDEQEKDNVEKMYDMYTKKKKNKVFKRDEEKEIVDTNEPKSKDGRKIN